MRANRGEMCFHMHPKDSVKFVALCHWARIVLWCTPLQAINYCCITLFWCKWELTIDRIIGVAGAWKNEIHRSFCGISP